MKMLSPDFKTVVDFRKHNIERIKPVFKEFVYLCKSLDLFGSELVGVDGSKFKAVNSTKRNFGKKTLAERLKQKRPRTVLSQGEPGVRICRRQGDARRREDGVDCASIGIGLWHDLFNLAASWNSVPHPRGTRFSVSSCPPQM